MPDNNEIKKGRIAVNYRSDILLLDDHHQLKTCVCKRSVGRPVCGDMVEWVDTGDGQASIERILPRHGLLNRPNSRGKIQPIATNIDQLVIVNAVVPEPNPNLIDRYLIAASELDISPLIVFNKIDLLEPHNQERFDRTTTLYRQLGYQVVFCHAKTHNGLDELRHALGHRTNILVGLSGVGKSSIIKALLPDLDIRIGEISTQAQEGKHTTTSTTLYPIAEHGYLIDSPGVRQFRVYHFNDSSLHKGFKEIGEYAQHCRFANCQHDKEPGCSVKDAVNQQKIDSRRYESYLQIRQSMNEKF